MIKKFTNWLFKKLLMSKINVETQVKSDEEIYKQICSSDNAIRNKYIHQVGKHDIFIIEKLHCEKEIKTLLTIMDDGIIEGCDIIKEEI